MKSKEDVETLLADLCAEALAQQPEADTPVMFFTRAPEGTTIAQGATTISLSPRGVSLIQQVTSELRKDIGIRTTLSRREIEEEVVTAMFQGAEALEHGNLDVGVLADALLGRLREGRDTWEVYLPIIGLELPEDETLSLAGGTFKRLSTEDIAELNKESAAILEASRWESPEKRESGIGTLMQDLDGITSSSKYWFHIVVEGRPEATKELAIEAAALGIDILLFWGLLVGINPETSSLGLPTQSRTKGMRSFQIAPGRSLQTHHSAPPVAFPFKLDRTKFTRLTNLPEFKKTQDTSNAPQPSEAEQKILMGIQQFAEAARLPSATIKLVWYLSPLETVLAKEDEGKRHKKVERRVKRLLNDSVASWVGPLYNKRRKPVHYGQRNRFANELVTDTDLQRARILAYMGIVHATGRVVGTLGHDAFLDAIDAP